MQPVFHEIPQIDAKGRESLFKQSAITAGCDPDQFKIIQDGYFHRLLGHVIYSRWYSKGNDSIKIAIHIVNPDAN